MLNEYWYKPFTYIVSNYMSRPPKQNNVVT